MRTAFLIALLLLLCSGCSKDEAPVPVSSGSAPEDVIIPLQVGNSWVLKRTEVDSNHIFIFASSETLKIVRDTLIAGQTWFIDQEGDTMQNRSDGLWKIIDGVPARSLRYPGSLGDSSTFTRAGQRISVKIVAANPLITTAIGQFTCVKYRTTRLTDGKTLREEYYSPGIGPITAQLYDTTAGGRSYQRYYIELAAWQVR